VKIKEKNSEEGKRRRDRKIKEGSKGKVIGPVE